jgi:2-polyprenyl-6-hydroxyphenyl methylase/3-demethylubiquinone-9 3-methyltransferase
VRRRPRNDPRQYDDLAGEWWKPDGTFAALHWLATARARLIPAPARVGAVLVDVGCGGGLLAPHVDGYKHIGVDVVHSGLLLAARRGVVPVQGDAHVLPLADEAADVVVAAEVLEHVTDLERAVAEIARVLRPGGTVVVDTINDTWLARFGLVTVGERVPGGAPPGIHDPALFVRPDRLQRLFARHGVRLAVRGIRPSALDLVAFLFNRSRPVRMLPTRPLWLVYQGVGKKGEGGGRTQASG